ncbi:fumarylacetoacetate hydrolase family protein [Halobacillus mangrovi]|uniref:Fumarylacetoacetate hydrolase n=1 Tax=Halobacillus mangrovi TaxID=402384 RepID=A0A1W5ZSX3_9BACI|nr:fumarylacetoacetate hydrolase family protein [Halobacillus mangrovi]ARI76406.1 fumarylacetoacetate hydrolase [Halobacillus mangrovi]
MRLANVKYDGKEQAAVVADRGMVFPMRSINQQCGESWPDQFFDLIQPESFKPFQTWWEQQDQAQVEIVKPKKYLPLYRHPRKIWGIGLNYVDHASDLDEKAPEGEPASFMKPDTSIIGYEDTICIPEQSMRTTAEAELGVIIGQKCKNVSEDEASDVIAGYTTIIDMTAEDILRRNPRYLTRSKSFDTFFSFGPQLLTPDEITDVMELKVTTKINGQAHRTNTVKKMTFDPYYLVAFHSKVMTLLPGDIISTGTPGAVVIRDGDLIECEIDGFVPLRNPVKDLKD